MMRAALVLVLVHHALLSCLVEGRVQLSGGVGNGPQLMVNAWARAFEERHTGQVLVGDWPSGGSASQKALVGDVDCKKKFKGHPRLCATPPSENATSWGAAGLTFPSDWYESYKDLDIQLLPMAVGALCVVYSKDVTGNLGSWGDAQLNMTLEVVASLIGGRITHWSDPMLQVQNPGLSLPHERVSVVVRSEKSSLNEHLTKALDVAAPWWSQVPGVLEKAVGKKPMWPLANYSDPDDQRYITRPTQMDMVVSVLRTPFSISYIDCAEVLRYQEFLGTSQLVNPKGRTVRPSATSIQKALDSKLVELSSPSSTLAVDLIDPTEEEAYPLSRMVYWYIKRSAVANGDCYKTWLIKEFVLFSFSEVGQAIAADYGWVLPSVSVLAIMKDRLNLVICTDLEHDTETSVMDYVPMQFRKCPLGQFMEVENGTHLGCRECRRGFYQPFDSAAAGVQCAPSPVGAAVSEEGQAKFRPCAPGSFQDREGQHRCKPCPRGKYSPVSLSSQCFDCPVGTSTNDLEGLEACIPCGFSEFSNMTGSGSCQKCPQGLQTPGRASTNLSSCGCPAGSFLPQLDHTCKECPRGLRCPGFGAALQSASGYMLLEAAAEDSGSFGVAVPDAYLCVTGRLCPGGLPNACAGDRLGLACSLCPKGQREYGDGCLACEGLSGLAAGALWMTFVVLLSAVGFLVLGRAKLLESSMWKVISVSAFGSLLNVLQVLGAFSSLSFALPPGMEGSSILMRLFLLDMKDVWGSACASWSPDVEYVLINGTVVVALLASLATFGFIQIFPDHMSVNYTKASIINWMGMIMNAGSVSLISMAVRPLACYEHPSGIFSLTSAPSIICGSGEQHGMIMAGIVVLLLSLLFVALVVVATWNARKELMTDARYDYQFRRTYAFLFMRSRPARWYWCCVLLVRNLSLGLIPLAVPSNARVQAVLCACVLIVHVVLQQHQRPSRVELSNLVDTFISATMILLLLLLSISMGLESGQASSSLGVLCSVCVGVPLGLAGGISIIAAVSPWVAAKKQKVLLRLFFMSNLDSLRELPASIQGVSSHIASQDLCLVSEAIANLDRFDAALLAKSVALLQGLFLNEDADASSKDVQRSTSRMSYDSCTSLKTLMVFDATEAGRSVDFQKPGVGLSQVVPAPEIT